MSEATTEQSATSEETPATTEESQPKQGDGDGASTTTEKPKSRRSGRSRAGSSTSKKGSTKKSGSSKSGSSKSNASNGTPKPKKPPTYGGTSEAPALGANGRRLWGLLQETLTQKQQRAIRRRVLEMVKEHKPPQKDTDRFIRWETIVEAAKAEGIEEINEAPLGEGLVRKLAAADKGGKLGKKPREFSIA